MSTKNKEKNLREKLFLKKTNGGKELSESEMKKCDKFSIEYKNFLNKSKTERENVNYILKKEEKKLNVSIPFLLFFFVLNKKHLTQSAGPIN